MAVRGDRRWTDYRATVRLRADDPGAVGLVFRHTDGGSWYRLSLDARNDERRLVRRAGGATTTLWLSQGGFPVGEPFELTVEAVGPRLRGYLGSTRLFEVVDGTHPSGRVGLFCSGNPAVRFERVEVRQPPPEATALLLDRFAAAGADGIRRAAGDPGGEERVLTARLQSPTGEAIGVVLGDDGAGGYHRFSMDQRQGERSLVRADAGALTVLWSDDGGYQPGRPYDLAIVARDGWLRGFLDGVPLFAVREPARPGRVGMYSGRNPDARFSEVRVYPTDAALHRWLVDERFDPARPPALTVLDEGDQDGPSSWTFDAGGLRQTSAIHGGDDDPADPAKPGTIALLGEPLTDFRFTTLLASGEPGAIGVVFRHGGAGDHYRFSMDRDGGYRRLVRVEGGEVTVLWEDALAYALDRDYLLTIDCVGELLRGFLDGEPLFELTDAAHAAGRVGLYCRRDGAARFREVRAAAPVWTPWCVLGAEEPLPAGARLRVHAGRDPGDAGGQGGPGQQGGPGDRGGQPDPEGVRHRYAAKLDDRGRISLPAAGAELRVRAPEGAGGHARWFLPPGDYAPVPVRLLRKADGTGVALFPLAGPLEPGQYRLHVEFRRDNRAADPASTVLRQAGSAAAELTDLDIGWPAREAMP
jgi:hypothetical protein